MVSMGGVPQTRVGAGIRAEMAGTTRSTLRQRAKAAPRGQPPRISPSCSLLETAASSSSSSLSEARSSTSSLNLLGREVSCVSDEGREGSSALRSVFFSHNVANWIGLGNHPTCKACGRAGVSVTNSEGKGSWVG